MKKICTIAALAAIVTTAYAAAPGFVKVQDQKALETQQLVNGPVKMTNAVNAQKERANGPAKISSVADLYGVYTAEYLDIDNSQLVRGKGSMTIMEGNSSDEVWFNFGGTPNEWNFPGVVNVNDNTVTITKYQTDYLFTDVNGYLYIQPYILEEGQEQGQVKLTKVNNITGRIAADGSIEFDNDGGFVFSIDGADGKEYVTGFGYCFDLKLTAMKYFNFNENEWIKLGEQATVTNENMVNSAFLDEYKVKDPYKVNAWMNKADKNLFCITNPYAGEEYSQLNVAFAETALDKNGAYVFDVTDPTCVLMQPLVRSGFWWNDAEEGEPANYQEWLVFNREGMMLENGTARDEIPWWFEDQELPMSTYDATTGAIEIRNVYFGLTAAPLDMCYFNSAPNGGTISITWPSMTGINDVEMNENAPVRYFNLQGMEVVNPVKGQLVIKTQGNKAQKVIVK